MYVDNLLNARYVAYKELTSFTLTTFESKPRVYDNFEILGTQIRTLHDGSKIISQRYYARTMKPADIRGELE